MKRANLRQISDGSQGPDYCHSIMEVANITSSWPIWRDKLPENRNRIAEGGQRVRGVVKSGTLHEPLVSYITVVRNNAKWLSRAIESVCKQSYKNTEHIVIDGASTDGTIEIIKNADSIDYFVSEPDEGLYDAINKAVPLARGQYICILNSDDWLNIDAASVAVKAIKDKNNNSLLFTGALVHFENGNSVVWPPSLVHPGSYFMCANNCHNGIYATRNIYELTGPYDNSYKIAADFKWIMRCLEVMSTFYYSNKITINYSLGGVSSNFSLHSEECVRAVLERFQFVTLSEAQGLYWCFFFQKDKVQNNQCNKITNHSDFIREILCKYSDKYEFVQAIAWASVCCLQHPSDNVLNLNSSLFIKCIVESVKKSLFFSPRLYAFARAAYRKYILRGCAKY